MQGHLYDSTEVHSSVLQIMVESGIIGTALFLGIFGFLFVQQIRRRKVQKSTV
jgi:O-antigen ligase